MSKREGRGNQLRYHNLVHDNGVILSYKNSKHLTWVFSPSKYVGRINKASHIWTIAVWTGSRSSQRKQIIIDSFLATYHQIFTKVEPLTREQPSLPQPPAVRRQAADHGRLRRRRVRRVKIFMYLESYKWLNFLSLRTGFGVSRNDDLKPQLACLENLVSLKKVSRNVCFFSCFTYLLRPVVSS